MKEAPPGADARAEPSARGSSAGLAGALAEQEEGLLNCVHCGFCLPACPTYRRLGDEADSPRGRLHLMRAVVEGRLDPGSDAFQTHMSRCLGCRACEPVCPSGVPYGELLELARQVGGEARRPPLAERMLPGVFGTAWIARPALALARLARWTRIPALAARLPSGWRRLKMLRFGMAMLAASAPAGSLRRMGLADGGGAAVPKAAPAPGGSAGAAESGDRAAPPSESGDRDPRTVALLAGCVQAGLFARVNAATVRVLEANGYRVVAAPGQGCCGALHAHAGNLDAARALARRNVEAFEAAGVDFVAMNASGCGAAVAEYGSLLAADEAMAPRAAAVAEKVRDVSQLLAARGPAPGGEVRAKATYDPPCHLLHAQRVSEPPLAVLDAVPGLELAPLRSAAECCGGAGTYGLTHPDLGGRIGRDKVEAVLETGADALVTGNPGCMMQIGGGLRLAGSRVAVVHLVELLDESYRRGGRYGGD